MNVIYCYTFFFFLSCLLRFLFIAIAIALIHFSFLYYNSSLQSQLSGSASSIPRFQRVIPEGEQDALHSALFNTCLLLLEDGTFSGRTSADVINILTSAIDFFTPSVVAGLCIGKW